MGALFIELTSDAHDLREHYVSVIALSAVEVTAHWAGMNHLLFSNGYRVPGRLFASLTILVTAEGLRGRSVVFCSTDAIETKALLSVCVRLRCTNKESLLPATA